MEEVPPVSDAAPIDNQPASIRTLREIVARLRAPDGCPWDREQTHASLRSGLIEEAYEVLDAIDRADDSHLREELGDLLLQVVMHAQIASEERRFTLEDVTRGICEKLVRRHPHVFGDVDARDTDTVLKNWEAIKRSEKPASASILDGVPAALPALLRAQNVQKKAARVGFDWPGAAPVVEKIREELAELASAEKAGSPEAIAEEIGDLLFSVVNLARKHRLDAELLLHEATRKFSGRFQRMECTARESGRDLTSMTLEEMDAIWERVKRE